MGRRLQNAKKLIYIFCEGESEQEYAKCLKARFDDVAVLRIPPPASSGLFLEAKDKFEKDIRLRSDAEVTDEIWFFFDAEDSDADKWEQRLKIVKHLRRLRKKPNIRVRLLMTSACVEYWFRLHFEMAVPSLHIDADKDRELHHLQKLVPGYFKGDPITIGQIAQNYAQAVQNGKQVLKRLEAEGMPLEARKGANADMDERDKWLHRNSHTFTTVQEAILFLESLQSQL